MEIPSISEGQVYFTCESVPGDQGAAQVCRLTTCVHSLLPGLVDLVFLTNRLEEVVRVGEGASEIISRFLFVSDMERMGYVVCPSSHLKLMTGKPELRFPNSWPSTFSVKFISFQRMCFRACGALIDVSKTLNLVQEHRCLYPVED